MKELKNVIKKCEVIEGIGAKSGIPYLAIELQLSNDYSERLFLSRPMAEMIKLLRKDDK